MNGTCPYRSSRGQDTVKSGFDSGAIARRLRHPTHSSILAAGNGPKPGNK